MSSYGEIINDIKISVSDFVCTIGGEIKNSEGVLSSVKTVGESGINTLKVIISGSVNGVGLTINKIFVSDDTEGEDTEEETEDTEEEDTEKDKEKKKPFVVKIDPDTNDWNATIVKVEEEKD